MTANRVALPSTTGQPRAVVILSHAADSAMANALGAWEALSAAGHLHPVMCVSYEAPASGNQPALDLGRRTRLLDQGAWSSDGLMYSLHGAGELGRVDVVSVATSGLAEQEQADLAQAGEMLRRDLRRIASLDTRVTLHRVWLPDYGDDHIAPSSVFVNAAADVAYVVLPTDRQFDRAMAMPLSFPDDPRAFGWHVAVEVASLAGLWSTMNGAPVEFVDHAASGVGTPLVRLVRSIGRAARIGAPSPERVLEGSGALPLVPGYLPAPDPAHLVRVAPQEIYPSAFCLADENGSAEEADDAHLGIEPPLDLAQERRRALEAVSGVLTRRDDMTEAALRLEEFAAETVEVAPWCEPLVEHAVIGIMPAESAGIDESGESDGSAEVDASDELEETGSAKNSDRTDEPDEWSEFDEPDEWAEPLEAAEAVAAARQLLDAGRPPISLDAVPTAGWDELLIGALGVVDASTGAVDVRTSTGGPQYLVLEPDAIAPTAEDLATLLADVELVEEANDSQADSIVGDDNALAGAPPTGTQTPAPTLLSGISDQFSRQARRASDRIDRLLDEFRSQLLYENRPEPGVTSFVPYALLVSVLIAAAALLTLTALREVFTPDHLSDALRVAIFGLLSLFVTLPPVLRLTPSRSMPAQSRLIWVTAGYAACATTLLVMSTTVARSFLDKPGRWLPAAAVIAVVVIVSAVAWMREFRGDKSLLGPLAPLVSDMVAGVVPLVYVFVIAVATLNYDATAPQLFEDQNWRVLTISLATALAVGAVSGGLMRAIRRRDRRQLREWKAGINSYVDHIELTAAQHDALRMLQGHWLATAVVLARLVHRPFGTEVASSARTDPEVLVRKLLIFELELTADAREKYLAELLPLIAPPGWLHQQYRRMADRFRESERARHGISPEEELPPPEHNAYPTPLEAARANTGDDGRWRFAREVHSGTYDSILRLTADEALEQAIQATFVKERIAVQLDPASGAEQTLPSLLGELLPVGDTQLPAAELPPSTEAAPEYTPHIWWPERIPMLSGHEPAEHSCGHVRVHGSLLFHAIRVDISEPIDVGRLAAPRSSQSASYDGRAAAPDAETSDSPPLM